MDGFALASRIFANPHALLATRAAGGGMDFDLDDIIERLQSVKGSRPGTCVQLAGKEAAALIAAAEAVVMDQPVCLELAAPLQVVGDVHGQFTDLLRLFEFRGLPPNARYLFLGDYVDRGPNGLECMFLLMALKIKYPEQIWMLRGNHECAAINRIYGFYDECKRRYSISLWKSFQARTRTLPCTHMQPAPAHVPATTTARPLLQQELFNAMPLAAVIESRIFCIHGGLSPDMDTPDDLKVLFKRMCQAAH